jgi:hypothetical protein
MTKQRRKPRTYYQQVATAVSFEGKLGAKLVNVFRKYNKLHFTFEHIVTKEMWTTTLSKLENYNHNKYRTTEGSRGRRKKNISYSYSSWKRAGEQSNNFVAYQCYIIECKHKDTKERFIKIGKTFVQVDSRLRELPYEYRVLKIYTGDAYKISKLEHELHRLNKQYKYCPTLPFTGMSECFSRIKKETYAY